MAEDEELNNSFTLVIGWIIMFSFVSVISFFMALLVLGGINNYVLQRLYSLVFTYVGLGLIPSEFGDTADAFSGIDNFVPYMDLLWLTSFITLIIFSLVFCYRLKRDNLFSLFNFSVLGLIIISFVGGYFIQLTDWFKTNVLFAVFPDLSVNAPIFAWYLDNIGIINLVIIVLCIIANFIDLDMDKYFNRKSGLGGGGDSGEI